MPIAQTLIDEVGTLFRSHWSERNGQNVPEAADVQLTNDAVKLDGTVLYADLADSTKMVDAYPSAFSAEFYKAFLSCAARIIRDEGGAITAYDGDRVMAVFIGDSKNTRAARTALKISWAMTSVVQPALRQQYPSIAFTPRHVVGVDTSPLFIARTGVRGANDLVWVGRAANHAAKMAALPETHSTYISEDVYDKLHISAKITAGDHASFWEGARWTGLDGRTIYRSNGWWHADFASPL